MTSRNILFGKVERRHVTPPRQTERQTEIKARKSSCGKPQEAYRPRCKLSKHNLSQGRRVPHPLLS